MNKKFLSPEELEKFIRDFQNHESEKAVKNLRYDLDKLRALERHNTDSVIARQISMRIKRKEKSLERATEIRDRKLRYHIDEFLKEKFRRHIEDISETSP